MCLKANPLKREILISVREGGLSRSSSEAAAHLSTISCSCITEDEVSNGWFVSVDAAFIMLIGMLAETGRPVGARSKPDTLQRSCIPAGGTKAAEASSI